MRYVGKGQGGQEQNTAPAPVQQQPVQQQPQVTGNPSGSRYVGKGQGNALADAATKKKTTSANGVSGQTASQILQGDFRKYNQQQTETQKKKQAVDEAQKALDSLLDARRERGAEARLNQNLRDAINEDKQISAARKALEEANNAYKLSIDDQTKAESNSSTLKKNFDDKNKALNDAVEALKGATTQTEYNALFENVRAAQRDAIQAGVAVDDYTQQLADSGYNKELADTYAQKSDAGKLGYRIGQMFKGWGEGFLGSVGEASGQTIANALNAAAIGASALSAKERSVYQIANNRGYGMFEAITDHPVNFGTAGGNIDLNDRPTNVFDEDGNMMTVNSITWTEKERGKYVDYVIPTVIKVDGEWKHVSDQEAIDHFHRTQEFLGRFELTDRDDHSASNAFAQQLHEEQAELYKDGNAPTYVHEFTQEQWDNMLGHNKRLLKEKYGIDTLEEFNATLAAANNKLNARMEDFAETQARWTTPVQEESARHITEQQVAQIRSSYGLRDTGTDKALAFVLETLPSGLDMAVDAVIRRASGLEHMGLASMGFRVFGSAYNEALQGGADQDRAVAYALAKAAIEIGTEMIGGEAIMDRFAYGSKSLLNGPIDAILGKIRPGICQRLASYAFGGASEGIEEVIAELLDPLAEGLRDTNYWAAVRDAKDEKTADDYIRAAAGGLFISLLGGGAVDVASSVINRANAARNTDFRNRLPEYNGNTAYSLTAQRLARINRNRAIESNPLLANQYQQNVASGMSEDAARANVTKRYDMGEAIYAEYSKNRTAQQMVEDTAAFAKANKNGNLTSAQEGQLLLDMDDKELGRVAEANANGIVIEYNDGSTEAVVFNGDQGLLDAGSKLADYIDQGAEIVDAEYSTGKAEMEEPAAAPAPQRAQVQNGADVFDNTQYRVEQTADGKFVVYDANSNAVGGTYDTYADAIGLVDQLSQNSTPSESPQNASQSVSQEEGDSAPPNEQNASEAQNEELNSKPDKNIKAKQNLTDEEELARLDGGIADTEFNPNNPMSPKKAQNLNRNERIERAQKWANYFGIKSDVHGLYDRLIGYITNPESTITDAQMDELFALLSQSAEIKSAQQEQRMAKTEEQTEEQEEDETTQTKYKDPLLGYDFTPDESDAEEAYDWKKVSQYMAEYDRSTVMERKSVLEGLFPDKEFRIADDGGSVEEVYKRKTSKSPFTKEEQSWWRKHGYEEITKKFKKSFFGADYLIPAWLRNGTYNKNLTDVTEEGKMGNRLSVRSMQYRGLRYYYQVGEGMYRHILDSNIMNGIRSVVERHEERVKNLRTRIENGYLYAEMPNNLSGISTERALQTVQQLEKQLKAEEGWLEKVRSGKYTLGNFYSDRSGVVTEADIQTVLDSVKGEDKTFENYSLKALQNAMSETMAKELIDSIYKEATDGINQEQSTNSTGDYQRVEAADQSTETGRAPSSVSGLSVYEQASQNQSESAGTGRLMDDSGTVSEVSGQGSTERKTGRRPLTGDEISTAAQEATDSINNWSEPADLTIRPKGAKPGATIPVKYIGGNIYLDGEAVGEIVPENYEGRLRQIAQQIKDAAAETGLSIVQIRGQLYSLNDDRDGSKFTNRTTAFAELSEGYIAISEITDESAGELILDTIHEITHENTLNQFGTDSTAILSFIDDLSETSGIDIKSKAQKVIRAYSADGVTFDSDCADEMISRIAEGHDCNGDFTAEEVVRLQEALFGSPYYDVATDSAPATAALLDYSRTQARNRPGAPNVGRVRAATDVGYTSSAEPQEDRLSEVVQAQRGIESQQTREQRRTALSINVAVAIQNGDLARAQHLINEAGRTQQADDGLYSDELVDMYSRSAQGEGRAPRDVRAKQTFDQYSDESFDALVNDTSYEEASAINGQNFNEYTTETFEDQVAVEQASETALMNEVSGREVDTSSATAEDFAREEAASEAELTEELSGNDIEAQSAESFDDLYNAEQQTENEALEDISSEGVDTDNAGAFDDLLERENQSIDDVLDELSGEGIDTENDELGERFGRLVGYQNEDDFIAGRKADYERAGKKPTGEDIYSSEKHPEHWERMQEADRRMSRLGRRSIGDAARMDKITGNSKVGKAVVEAFKDIRTIQKEVMSGSRTLTEFYHTLSSHANERGISQIVDSRIINLAKTAAQLERVAYATESETDKALASAAASRLFGALANNAERVNRIQYEQMYKLVKASEANGKGNSKNPFVRKMQWYNRMQISGGNFWRMIDGYNRGNGIGYNWKDRHELALNRQIKTQAEALSYFADIKADKGYYDFASGKARGKVDSMLNEVTLKMMLDSLAREDRNGNLHFDEVIKQKGFTFEDAKGNQRFVPIEGNTIREKTNFIRNLYDTVSEDIENNSAAKAYRDAASAMFYSFKGKLESTYEALNGYSKQFYEEGKYFPVRYNDNPTAAKAESDTWTFRNVKGRTGTAGKVYRIMPASAVVDSYISQASNYVAFSEIGADLNLLNNGQGAFGSLSDTVGKNFGKTYGDWFTKYVKDMNMLREPDLTGVNKVIEKQRQLVMQGALLFSTSVPIKQTASYFSAMGTLDPVAVMEAWRPVVRASGGKDIKNPFMQARMQGSAIDPDVSAFLKTDWVSRLRNKGGVLGKIVDMTNVMDSRTVANVWKATLIDVKRTSGLSASQLFVKQDGKFTGELTPMGEFLVSTKFENAVLNTQPIFTKQARAEIARTDNMALKLLSTFRTQQTQNYNLMLTAMEEYRADKRAGRATDASGKRLRQTMEGQVLAAASLAALSMIADVMKHSLKKYKDDDDKDKFDPMKMLDRFNKNFAETAAGNWLFVGDLAKLGIDFATGAWNDPYASKEFYGVSAGPINTYMSIINSAKNVWKDINEDNGKHFASNMRYLVGNIATARGIPLNNAYTVANSLVQYIGDVAGWDRHNYEDLLRTWDYNRTNYSQHLYEAVKAGNKDKADKAIEGLEQNLYDNQTLEQRLKGIGRTWLKDGEDPEYVIDYLIDYAGMEEEDASKYVYRAMMEVETGHNFYNMQEDLAKGEYTVEEAAKYLQKYAGYDEKFSNIVANEYLFANEYPDHTYEDITDMYVNSELDLDTATDWLVRTSWQTESYARQNLEDARLFKLWDYEPYARTDNSMNDTYATGEKTGLRNFWNQYQDRFKSPKVFGSIFKDIDSYKKSKDYGNYTYVWDGVETQAGNEASAIIESLNKHIANGDITYDTARLIWTQHYARKTSKSGLWKWVKAA